MENRIITIVSTANSSKVEIETNATTLGELKAALRNANVDYAEMTFYEGLTKTELIDDASLLPHDVIRNGEPTNNLVFMLTNTNKKIKSGADRTELYIIIKDKGLAEACKAKYGKNFTQVKTFELEELIEEASKKSSQIASKTVESKETCEACKCENALRVLVGYLYYNDAIDKEQMNEVLEEFSKSEAEENKDSVYKKDEIDDMFSFLN